MSPDQIFYYIRFHKILIFDCIARTNRYDMVLYLFLIFNNIRSQLVASALLKMKLKVHLFGFYNNQRKFHMIFIFRLYIVYRLKFCIEFRTGKGQFR
jgi:hypothetical protein